MADIDTIFGQTGSLIKVSQTVDNMGRVTDTTETSYSATFSLQPMTYQDRVEAGFGVEDKGEVKIFLKPQDDGESVSPAIGDIILHSSVRYRIERLLPRWIGSQLIFYKADCHKIDG